LLTVGHGVPISLAVGGADWHDTKLTHETVEGIVVEYSEPSPELLQGMCPDKSCDCYQVVRNILAEWGFAAHIRARRWVAKLTQSWINHFRRIVIRWEKKPENSIVFLHFACTLIAFWAARLFG